MQGRDVGLRYRPGRDGGAPGDDARRLDGQAGELGVDLGIGLAVGQGPVASAGQAVQVLDDGGAFGGVGQGANMSASWLAQMGWDVWVLDMTTSANYTLRHIPGAWFVVPSQLAQALQTIPQATHYVLTCGSSLLARYAAVDVARTTGANVQVLEGGTLAWVAQGLPLEQGETHLASPRIDRYRRPYEGTDSPREAMQAYLDWEFGLVEQLGRDGTHGFRVI